ncbi:PQQ-binding-like beta-propeller repeat protein [Streptomyces sp. FXJ1.4098]|nr:PQQ-binding-like beta-propeller repeat protein [Streptomyces sp. FXJ1.4098]
MVIGAGTAVLLRDSGDSGDPGPERAGGKPGGTSASATPKPTSVKGRELFQVAAPEVNGAEYVATPGTWVTSRYYASGAKNSVTGYDLTTGKLAWTVNLSGGLCQVSRDVTRNGLIAVVIRESTSERSSDCTRFAVIDVNKGTKVWEKPLTDDGIGRGADLTVAISDTVAAAGWPSGSAAFDASSGSPLWDAPAKGCFQEEHLGGSEQLLTLAYCRTADGMRFRVGERDPRSGKATWKYEIPKAKGGAWLISSKPLVVGLIQSVNGLDAEQLVTVSEQGKVQSTIELGDDYIAGCGDAGTCAATVVAGDTAYLASDPHAYGKANQITAFDLRTGTRIQTFKAPGKSTLIPVRADGKALIALQKGDVSTAGRVLRLDPDTGKATTLLQLPDEARLGLQTLADKDVKHPALYADGRLFLHRGSGYSEGDTNRIPMTLAYTNH